MFLEHKSNIHSLLALVWSLPTPTVLRLDLIIWLLEYLFDGYIQLSILGFG